jgi:hypothetical protein
VATSRLLGRRGDGSAVVNGWVAIYTLGLPEAIRTRRREEVAADLREEALDAVRHGRARGLVRQRLRRWLVGIPDDLAWRAFDAPDLALDLRLPMPWLPLNRWSSALLAIAAIGAAGGLALVAIPYLTAGGTGNAWAGWGPIGFMLAATGVLAAILVSVPWPSRGVAIVIPSVLVGFAAAPVLWGCWALAAFAVIVRMIQVPSTPDRR